MSRLRSSIAQLPSWPALAIAGVLAVGVGSWYYVPTYRQCSELKQSRDALRAAIDAVASTGGVVDLAAVFPGPWDEVRIAQEHRLEAGQAPIHCPFGWDLSRLERRTLIDSGRYTLIGFFERGRFQRYVEYRGDWARFEGDLDVLSRARARFEVDRSSAGPHRLTLAGP
jgi:hypothetical protein